MGKGAGLKKKLRNLFSPVVKIQKKVSLVMKAWFILIQKQKKTMVINSNNPLQTLPMLYSIWKERDSSFCLIYFVSTEQWKILSHFYGQSIRDSSVKIQEQIICIVLGTWFLLSGITLLRVQCSILRNIVLIHIVIM